MTDKRRRRGLSRRNRMEADNESLKFSQRNYCQGNTEIRSSCLNHEEDEEHEIQIKGRGMIGTGMGFPSLMQMVARG